MPRGRHRHSPPLHRLLPPSAIAGVSVVWALAPWVFTEPMVLRGLAAAAAATAVVGAVVMRRWDTQAGKRVADLTRARASDEWRYEERVAELETDLEESRELRVKLEQRLRAKRAELAGLRNEHAALLRRYATAEADRASVLEERRVLEIEAATPARALPPVPVAAAGFASASAAAGEAGAVAAPAEAEGAKAEGAEPESVEEAPVVPAVFSPEGSGLFLRAKAALARFDGAEDAGVSEEDGSAKAEEGSVEAGDDSVEDSESPKGDSGKNVSPESDSPTDESPMDGSPTDEPLKNVPPKGDGPSNGESLKAGSVGTDAKAGDSEAPETGATETGATETGVTETSVTGGTETEPALEDEAQGKPEAADGHERAAATTTAGALAKATPALPAAQQPAAQQPAGHFIAPTAVAVVPATPVRRQAIEGGFDFFGTKTGAEPSALESVQNEDLADVVGQEALALHKAEAEAEFKPADEESRGIGQVIDLTAHDETEQIDVQGLRSAVS
ncbi:hypothetical protein ABZ078_12835 [Streptomyces sp. NPDC006385]|uniref:hypothetical protein n=1 Tax=Streptomyces sp. NPDC006385 TaxID=3156761 RepID=UPI0033B7BF70